MRRAPSLVGLICALLFFWISLSPSLLPRSWVLQGVVGAIAAITGYAIGCLGGSLVRFTLSPEARRIAWWVLAAVGTAGSLALLRISAGWQREIRLLMGMDTAIDWHIPLIALIAALTFTLFLLVARAVRLAVRKLISLLSRFIPRLAAQIAGLALAALVATVFLNDFLYAAFLRVMNNSASLTDGGTSEGVTVPVSPLLSGGPGSLASWDSLGSKGRDFTGTAVSEAELTRFAGRAAKAPIRVYAGLRSADSFDEQADLALRELERTGAFERSVLGVMITTGTGWVNANVADTLEYMHAGDTAMVAMQYSYLPSWMSFLVDRSKATEAGSTLVRAVHARWSALPPAERPKLVVYGESLGSYGAEGSFAGLGDLLATVDGALLVGPPNFNPLWTSITAGRDAGSPMWRPVYNGGGDVRFAQFPADLSGVRSRVVYLQNASDPIVWWSPRLLFERPGWLEGVRGPDVAPAMRWYPIVTFWQVVVDLMFSNDVPPGHGHRYGSNVVDGWATIIAPPAWTEADTGRLKHIVDKREN